jgi:hypothetical protein
MNRKPYIKPSLLQLDFSTDEAVASGGTCKSFTSTNGSGIVGTGNCDQQLCNSAQINAS